MPVFFETSQMILMGNQVENHWSKFGCEDCLVVTTSPMGMRVGVESGGGMGKDRGCESVLTLTIDSKAREVTVHSVD